MAEPLVGLTTLVLNSGGRLSSQKQVALNSSKAEGEGYVGSGWIGLDWRSQLIGEK